MGALCRVVDFQKIEQKLARELFRSKSERFKAVREEGMG